MPVHKIRAAVLRKRGGPLEIESIEMEGPREDEVLVRTVASGICHTDIDFCDDWDETDTPVVLGHEGAGVVERVGKKVKSVKRGDHVVLSYQPCGHCRQCRSGHPSWLLGSDLYGLLPKPSVCPSTGSGRMVVC